MNKKFYLTLALSALAAFLFSGAMLPGGKDMPKPEAEDLWNYISEESPYVAWKQWPGKEGMYEGQSPHGAYLKLFVNDKAYAALQAGEEMPDGAIVVKENYADDKETLVAITPMYKSKGYNPDAGDWFWAKYSEKADVQAAGKVESCIECHMKAKDHDWLFSMKK